MYCAKLCNVELFKVINSYEDIKTMTGTLFTLHSAKTSNNKKINKPYGHDASRRRSGKNRPMRVQLY